MISKIEYELIPPDKSNKPTLVFIHGGGGDKNQWYSQHDYFRAKGFGILAFSFSSNGKSAHSSNNSILDYVKEVSYLISDLK
ncbi:MAG: alpha/beta hydrolase family protein, partial [Candidatus Hodarchaeales archaeon]